MINSSLLNTYTPMTGGKGNNLGDDLAHPPPVSNPGSSH